MLAHHFIRYRLERGISVFVSLMLGIRALRIAGWQVLRSGFVSYDTKPATSRASGHIAAMPWPCEKSDNIVDAIDALAMRIDLLAVHAAAVAAAVRTEVQAHGIAAIALDAHALMQCCAVAAGEIALLTDDVTEPAKIGTVTLISNDSALTAVIDSIRRVTSIVGVIGLAVVPGPGRMGRNAVSKEQAVRVVPKCSDFRRAQATNKQPGQKLPQKRT